MKLDSLKIYSSAALLVAAATMAGCGGGGSGGGAASPTPTPTPPRSADEGTAQYVSDNKELKGDFEEDVTLVAGETYKITGEVNFLEGTTLTIPAGTTLYGSTGQSYLAINRGAMIMAEGTEEAPIIFTSAEDIAGQAGQNDQGQWGGLTILGQSTNNKGERTYEAGTQPYGPKDGEVIADDNSGVLQYVVIKYSGYEVEKDKELNGLSLASVGSGTTIENVAIIGSADDGIEFWGGTVNVTNLYVYNAGDDSIDTDQGYTGTIDGARVQQVIVDDETGSRAIEADSFDEAESGDPVAIPVLKNATLNTIGRAVRLREGTGYVFENVMVNVQSSSALPEDEGYAEAVAAIRISDQHTLDGANISTAGAGLAIKNDAVDVPATDINAAGEVVSGLGLYYDTATQTYFSGLDVHDVVGVSGDMVDEEVVGADGVFTAEVASDNTVTGAGDLEFDWANTEIFSGETETLKGDITADLTLSASTLYFIDGEVNVVDGVTLTIEPGTTIAGLTGSSYLAVNRGAMIMAEGTAESPIVFTSAQDVAGQNTGDEQGQWGGLTILGSATANKGERTYEAGTQKYGPIEGVADDADNSGVLKYVVIKYSGYEVEKDKELNGLSLAAVGFGTTIENVAIIGSADDGIELWGGTVNVSGLYVYNAGDDSIDTDQGYIGTISNVYAEQNIVDDEEGSRVIEADSFDQASAGTPQALVTMENAILKSVGRAVRLREGTGYDFDNVLISVESGDPSIAAFRISDVALSGTAITNSGALAIETSNGAPLLHDADTEAYFSANITLSDAADVTVTEYDRSWIPNWNK